MLKYETPLAEVITFRLEDVLTASPPTHGHGDGDGFGGGDIEVPGDGSDGLFSILDLITR